GADGTVATGDGTVINGPNGTNTVGVRYTLLTDAVGHTHVYTPFNATSPKQPGNYTINGNGDMLLGGLSCMDSVVVYHGTKGRPEGTTPFAISSQHTGTASGAGDPGAMQQFFNTNDVGCACRNEDPSLPTLGKYQIAPSLGMVTDGNGGTVADFPVGMEFCGGYTNGTSQIKILGDSKEEAAKKAAVERDNQDKTALKIRYNWMTEEEFEYEYKFRRALLAAMDKIVEGPDGDANCFAGDNKTLPSTYWERVKEGNVLTKKWKVKQGQQASDAVRALENGLKDGTAKFDCTLAVHVATLIAALAVSNDEYFNKWFEGKSLGDFDNLDYYNEKDGTESLPGDWDYFPNDPRYKGDHPDGNWAGENVIAGEKNADGKRTYAGNGLDERKTADQINDTLKKMYKGAPEDWMASKQRSPRRIIPPGGRKTAKGKLQMPAKEQGAKDAGASKEPNKEPPGTGTND
ncbi:MAG: hypothetical protein KF754_15310, partial [Planctomycetes bacterium]|nr:hypothetical protein [Planctomycetota bacterium]